MVSNIKIVCVGQNLMTSKLGTDLTLKVFYKRGPMRRNQTAESYISSLVREPFEIMTNNLGLPIKPYCNLITINRFILLEAE